MRNALTTTLKTVSLVALLSSSAHALTQKVDVKLHGELLRGHDQLGLKRLVNQELRSRSALMEFKLKKVELKAKSKQGHAELTLAVGRNEAMPITVPGNEENFESNYSGYHSLTIHAPRSYRGQTDGPWKLHSRGLVKIDKVSVLMQKELNYNFSTIRNAVLEKQVEFKADKVIGSTKTIHPRGPIKGIVLEGTKEKVKISEVKIKFRDGQEVIVDELEGKIRNGQVVNFALKRELAKPVRSIRVTAVTTSLFGSRGKLAVHIAQ